MLGEQRIFQLCLEPLLHRQIGRSTVWAKYATFRTARICPRISRVYHLYKSVPWSHLPNNDREGLKLVSKMALKKWKTKFRLEYSVRKNRSTFSERDLLQLLSSRIFRKRLVNRINNQNYFVESVYVHICYSERTLWTMMLNALVGLRNGMDS